MSDEGPPRGSMPPPEAFKGLVRRFSIHPGVLTKALERLKNAAGLPPPADTLVDAEGNVYIAHTGEWIGNLIDEV